MSQGSFPMASTVGHPSPSCDEPITALVEGTRRLAEEMDRFVVMFNRYRAHMEKSEHEVQAAVRLQAAARGFLVRNTTRKMRAAINPAPSTIPSTASLGIGATHTVQPALTTGMVVPTSYVNAPPDHKFPIISTSGRRSPKFSRLDELDVAPPPTPAVSSVLSSVLVLLDRPSVLVDCYILKLAVGLFSWDPGGHSCHSNLFHILTKVSRDVKGLTRGRIKSAAAREQAAPKGGRDVMWGSRGPAACS
jgi:hypothetical protein